MRLLTSAIAAGSLIGGYATARYSKKRALGGVVLAAGGITCGTLWWRSAGPVPAVIAAGIYLSAFGGSHPLAKTLGAWPSVLAVATTTAVSTYAITAPIKITAA